MSLETLIMMSREFAVSKEAMARAFVDAHMEPVALIVSRRGRVERFYRHEDFPFLATSKGTPLPPGSISSDGVMPGECSEAEEVDADCWLTDRGADRTLVLSEQVLGQRQGFALTLLQAELDEEE